MALFVEGMDGRIALSSQIEYREGTKRRPMALSVDSNPREGRAGERSRGGRDLDSLTILEDG